MENNFGLEALPAWLIAFLLLISLGFKFYQHLRLSSCVINSTDGIKITIDNTEKNTNKEEEAENV